MRLGILLLAFLLLGLVYNLSLPLFEAPDELPHFRYAHWLAEEGRLPHLVRDSEAIGHEVGQPFLYYALLAPVVRLVEIPDLTMQRNPAWPGEGITNVYFHTPAERFPYSGMALAVHLARFATTIIASLTIISTYGIARLIRPEVALLSAGLVAFNPQFLFMSAVVNNDTLVTALSSSALLLLVWGINRFARGSESGHSSQHSHPGWWFYAILGILWGLATLAKLSGLALGVVIFAAIALLAWQRRSISHLLLGGLAALGGLVAVTGWWFVHNWYLYGDPLAWNVLVASNQALVRPQPLDATGIIERLPLLWRTFWAMPGNGIYGLPAPSFFYWLIAILALLAFLGLLRRLWQGAWSKRQVTLANPVTSSHSHRVTLPPCHLVTLTLLAFWLLLILALTLVYMRYTTDSAQGRLALPAIASFAVLMAVGMSTYRGWSRWLGALAISFLALSATLIPFLLIRPAYAQPEPLSAGIEIPNPLSVQYGEQMALVGYELSTRVIQPGERLTVDLYWQAVASISQSNLVGLRLLDANGRVASNLEIIPGQARYPTFLWPTAQPFRDRYTMPPIATDAQPGLGHLVVVTMPWVAADEPLPARVGGVPVDEEVIVATLKIAPLEAQQYRPSQRVDATFGGQARLLGFDAPELVQSGRPFTVTLYWEALAPDGHDYTVFVHLLDEEGELVAQDDNPPQEGRYPTSIWAAGEQVRDSHRLSIPAGVHAGQYRLQVGLYDPASGLRLTARRGAGSRWRDDSVGLGIVEVDEP